jgi:23S rRNA (uracil1939-C5)-methyltransferase
MGGRTSPASSDAPLLLDVERLTFGFDALAHREHQVVFVPYAAPGDRVLAEPVERRPGYLRARVLDVVTPGPARVLPGCAYFPTCGGCQWQHVAPPAQREGKAAVVAEQLARIAGLRDVEVLPTLASPTDWGYRARLSLAVEGRRAGYQRARSHVLVEVADCPIADPVVSAHVDVARAWITSLRVALRRVTVAAAPGGVVLTGAAVAAPKAADLEASEALLARHASVRGAVLAGGGVRKVAGDPTVRVPLEPGLDLEVPADVFTQVNPGANRILVATVLALGRFAAGERVLDLYCGAGNFALPLARRRVRVHGVERDPIAVEAGRANAARLGLADATFEASTVARALARGVTDDVDAVVLDPPRSGAADALPALAALRARRILYVSCDPATLARDVRALATHGYHVARVQPLDLFPQTYHVETVAELRLT